MGQFRVIDALINAPFRSDEILSNRSEQSAQYQHESKNNEGDADDGADQGQAEDDTYDHEDQPQDGCD